MQTVICPYCQNPAEFVTGDVIYPHRPDLADKKFYLCRPCNAYVGCHAKHPKYNPTGDAPLGRLADAELRKAKSAVHAAFDPLWRDMGAFPNQKAAYAWLAGQLSIPVAECHVGMFDVERCRAAQDVVNRCWKTVEPEKEYPF